ncbi:MAG: carboxypeptidase regulatory-like domain-containing protein [Acidobacteria bacterium]|nr:carboxypeptidase regulatory-like domain-containing protein [Acidobacteriota bacterium]
MKLQQGWIWILVGALTLAGQTSGTFNGTVRDESGAVVPGAQVQARSLTSGDRREAATGDKGVYSLPFLPPGDYELTVTKAGFATVTQKATLNLAEVVAVDVTLKLSTTAEKIEVSSNVPLLQSENAALGRVVEGSTVKELPLSSRNFTQLLALSPGTSGPLNDAGSLGRGTQNISAGGARLGSNSIYIDGVDAVNIHSNTANENAFASNGLVAPSPEAIQEFKVQTGLYDATSGRSGGAAVVLVTKSGGPQFHGTLFEFFRNNQLNANSFFFNSTGQNRPVLKQNQFGGNIGGPVKKDKTFFFFSYQGTRQRNGLSGSSSLTLPRLTNDRSRAALGRTFAGVRGTRGGPAILADGSNINPVSFALLNTKLANGDFVIPTPQSEGAGVNYTVSIPARYQENQYISNGDHQLTSMNRLSFKSTISAQPAFQPLPAATVPGFGTTQDFKSRILSLTDTHVFTPNLVNEARMGFSRLLGVVQPETQIPLSSIGMRRFNSDDFFDIPQITVTGAFSLGYSVNADQGVAQNTFHWVDTLSWTKGEHQLRGGFEARRYQDNYYSNNRMRGTMTLQSFGDLLLGLPGTPLAEGGNRTGFSNINTSSVASGVAERADRMTDFALFVQDDLKVSSKLTVNLGLRWDYLGLAVDTAGRNGSFDTRLYQPPPVNGSTSAGFVQMSNARRPVAGLPNVAPTLVDNEPNRNFAPRFGMAYRVTSKLVARGGYGIYYDRLSNQLGLLQALSLPSYVRTDLQAAAAINASLQNPYPNLPQRSQFPVVPQLFSPPYTNLRPAIGLNAADPNLRTPYMQQWGLNLQYQATASTMVEVGYQGTKGTRLATQRLINQPILASPEQPINGITTNTTGNAALRVPYVGFSPTGLVWLETSTDSRYNSLQASVSRRFSKGLRLLGAYTFAKSLDNNSGSGTGASFTQTDGDQLRLGLNRGLSDFDRTHRMVFNFSYNIPNWGFGLNRTAFGKKFFDGWQVSGVSIIQSGTPISILDTSGAALYGTSNSRASWAPGATVESATLEGRPQDRLNRYFDTVAFVRSGNLWGDTGRNILRGPSQRNVDLSVNKRFAITERVAAEWRSEFFNVFNLVNFANPGGSITAVSYGVIRNTTGNPRVIQLAVKLVF